MQRIAVLVVLIVIVLVLIACVRSENADQATRQAWEVTVAAWKWEATATAQAFYLRAIATPTCPAQQKRP